MPFAAPLAAARPIWEGTCGLGQDGQLACRRATTRGGVETSVYEAGGVVQMDTRYCNVDEVLCTVLSDGRVDCPMASDDTGWRFTGDASGNGWALGGRAWGVAAGYGWVGCAVLEDGTVTCWQRRLAPHVLGKVTAGVPGVSDAVEVASSCGRACAVRRGGGLSCWKAAEPPESAPPAKTYLAGAQVADVAVGEDHVCAVVDSGTVYCWGANNFGQLGDGSRVDRGAPAEVRGVRDAVGVAVAAATTCVVHASGGVSCWGRESRW